MDTVLTILGIAGLFMLRIGLPIVALVTLAFLIDRWQTRREEELKRRFGSPPIIDFEKARADREDEEERDRAA